MNITEHHNISFRTRNETQKSLGSASLCMSRFTIGVTSEHLVGNNNEPGGGRATDLQYWKKRLRNLMVEDPRTVRVPKVR
jgi:hypothetical protein